jgi:8-oxo-dGTP diphosphatase
MMSDLQSDASIERPDSNRFYLCVKGLIYDATGRVLLLRRTQDTRVDPGKWDLPGGKLDTGELFDEAFRREVREETGIEIEITGVAGARAWTMPERRVAYLFMEARAETEAVTLSDEHIAYAWVEPASMAEYDLAPQFHGLADRGAKQ